MNIFLNNKKGFSLPEVIVAIAVLGLLATLFSEVVFSALKARDSSRERLEALAIATSSIDEIKSYRSNTDTPAPTPPFWHTLDQLKTLTLGTDPDISGPLGYVYDETDASGNTFLREYTDSNNILYQIKIEIDPDNSGNNIAGVFDIKVTVSSKNVPSITAVTRIRGG